jgi:replication-associated recombination protein RarA
VHVLEAVTIDDIVTALKRALHDHERGLGGMALEVSDESLRLIAHAADGDVRRGLTLLEIAAELAENHHIDGTVFYEPAERGLELKLREKLLSLREARRQARKK